MPPSPRARHPRALLLVALVGIVAFVVLAAGTSSSLGAAASGPDERIVHEVDAPARPAVIGPVLVVLVVAQLIAIVRDAQRTAAPEPRWDLPPAPALLRVPVRGPPPRRVLP